MRKVILVAFSLHPKWGSEAGRANMWLNIISQKYSVDVFADAIIQNDIDNNNYANTCFHFIEGTKLWRKFGIKTGLINLATGFFFRKVYKEISKLDLQEYEFIHCITPAGIHSHNKLYKLNIPLVIGPLGGGLASPKGFAKAFQYQRVKSKLRDYFYWARLRWSIGLRKYLTNADKIILGMSLRPEVMPVEVRHKCISIPDVLVNTDLFTANLNKENNAVVRVLYAGRFISNKGPMLLLDAIKRCLDKGVTGFIVEFAGYGPLEKHMKRKIVKENLDENAKIIGGLRKEELVSKYHASDIFCLPTLREPGGIAILEAMSCGLPVITSNYGGPAISVNKDCGILINMTNYEQYVDDFSDALIYLVNNRDTRRKMGYAGSIRVKSEYSMEALSKKIYDLYADLTSE